MITLVDSIECPAHTGHPIPGAILNAQSVGAYNYGNSWPDYDDYSAVRPDLAEVGWIVTIALRPGGHKQGILSRCFDVEPDGGQNWEIDQFMREDADRTWGLPWLYTYASNATAMLRTAGRYGWLQGRDFYYWSAHQAAKHICSPTTCGYPQADGTQYGFLPGNCDVSLLSDYMLPPLPITIELPEDPGMITAVLDQKGSIHVFPMIPHDGNDLSKGATVYEVYQQGSGGPGWTGGEAGKQKAKAYPLVRIPENAT